MASDPVVAHVNFDATIANSITMIVKVKPTLRYTLRLRLALVLVQITAYVAGFDGVDVTDTSERDE